MKQRVKLGRRADRPCTCSRATAVPSQPEPFADLLARSSVGRGLARIRREGLAAELAHLEHEMGCPQRPRRGGAGPKPRKSLPRKRKTLRRTLRVVDEEFMELVHLMPCQARMLPGHRCDGPIQAHHAGAYTSGPNPHGKGQKPDDDTCIALCAGAHEDIEHHVGQSGTFKAFDGAGIRAWQDDRIEIARAFVAARRAGERMPEAVRW